MPTLTATEDHLTEGFLDFSKLPTNTTELDTSEVRDRIKGFTGKTPEGCRLEKLISCSCEEQLETLNLSTLPTSLQEIDFSGSYIKNLTGSLPENSELEKLSLLFCLKLETLSLPTNSRLKELDLSSCKKLEINPSLIRALGDLKNTKCSIVYPKHFLERDAKLTYKRLQEVIARAPGI
jgi:Leucine-rich repeat (LRR) protein